MLHPGVFPHLWNGATRTYWVSLGTGRFIPVGTRIAKTRKSENANSNFGFQPCAQDKDTMNQWVDFKLSPVRVFVIQRWGTNPIGRDEE